MGDASKVPDNWRELHDCKRFKVDEQGRCVFCQMNEKFRADGDQYETIPFDVPGVYDPSQEPNVVIRETPKAVTKPN